MKLLFKQRAFTWFDSYDIYDENENTVYVVKGQLSWGHCLKIFDASEEHELGTVKEQIFSWWPQFELYEGSDCIGTLKKEPWGWFKPRYNIDFNGWHPTNSMRISIRMITPILERSSSVTATSVGRIPTFPGICSGLTERSPSGNTMIRDCLRPTGLRTIPCDRYPPVPGSMRTSMP